MTSSRKKTRYVSKVEFRKLVASERKVAATYGFEIKIQYKPFKWERVRDGHHHTGVSGLFSSDRKKIQITVIGRPGRGQVLSVLYHEMRHLEHFIKGMYPDYYRLTEKVVDPILRCTAPEVPKRFEVPSIRTALEAERDCNRIAEEKLATIGIKIDLPIYREIDTLSWSVVSSIKLILFDLEEASKVAKDPAKVKFLKKESDRVRKVLMDGGYKPL